jgi:hypothetical protein
MSASVQDRLLAMNVLSKFVEDSAERVKQKMKDKNTRLSEIEQDNHNISCIKRVIADLKDEQNEYLPR